MQPKKIPTILGLLLVFGAITIFAMVYNKITPLVSRASTSLAPKDVVVSNISDTTFSVSWITTQATIGVVTVEEVGGTKYTAFDDRDQAPSSTNDKPITRPYTTHMVTVRSAKPDSVYHVRILSNGKPYQNGNTPYEIHTGASLSGKGTILEPAFGTVTTATEQPAEGAIVYVTPEGGQTVSTLVTTSGSWVIPLHLVRSQNLQSYLPSADRINESIIIQTAQGDATAQTDTINDNPVPAMTVGKNYDFRKIQADVATPKPIAIISPSVLGETTQAPTNIVDLTQPKEGAALSSSLPLFTGTGVPNHQILLIIGMTSPYTDTTTVEQDGIWRYTPKTPLAPGKQSVTITTTDAQNKSVAITHLFEVLKSGTQVLGDATPSATIAPTITVDMTPTPTSTLAGEPIPKTGSPLPLILMLIVGFGLLSSGIIVLQK